MAYEYNGLTLDIPQEVGDSMVANFAKIAPTGANIIEYTKTQLASIFKNQVVAVKAVLKDRVDAVASLMKESSEYHTHADAMNRVIASVSAPLVDGVAFNSTFSDGKVSFTVKDETASENEPAVSAWSKIHGNALPKGAIVTIVDNGVMCIVESNDVRIQSESFMLFAKELALNNGLKDEDITISWAENRPRLAVKSAPAATKESKESGDGVKRYRGQVNVKFGGTASGRTDSEAAFKWLCGKKPFGADADEMKRRALPKAEGGEGVGSVLSDFSIQKKYNYRVFGIDENGMEFQHATRIPAGHEISELG